MNTRATYDAFYVTSSKWKVWSYSILCWIIACLPLFVFLLFSWSFLIDGSSPTSGKSLIGVYVVLLSLFAATLLFASIPFVFLRWLKKPMAIITRDGFAGLKNLRERQFAWSPQTIIYNAKGNIVLANPVAEQSYTSKLWGGHKAAVMVYNGFAKESRQEVLDAIDRLSPYAIERTTIWAMAKH